MSDRETEYGMILIVERDRSKNRQEVRVILKRDKKVGGITIKMNCRDIVGKIVSIYYIVVV